MNPIDRPTGAGWWWWRPDSMAPWQALEVVNDRSKDELLVRTDSDDLYQCDGDPEHEWTGEWHSEQIQPPAR